jgi:hypothetical protein
MLKELFDAIVSLGNQASRPHAISTPEPAHVYALSYPDGKVEWINADPAPRCHTAQDLETVAAWALAHVPDGPVSVWVSRAGVVALLDDRTRRDRVSLPLDMAPQIGTLAGLRFPMTQKDFVRLLRVDLAGCGAEVAALLKAARSLKILNNVSAEGRVNHGQQSVTKGMVSQAANAVDYPEEVAVQCPVFTSVNTDPETVQCAVDLDPTEAKPLQLIPLPGEVEAAIQRAERVIQARLSGLLFGAAERPNVRLSYGRP